MNDYQADVVVIGSGPGGEGAAMQLSKGGKRVILVERYEKVGGGCTHWGTIPSKALRAAIFQLTETLNNPLFAKSGIKVKPTVADLTRTAQRTIDKQVSMRTKFYSRNDVEILFGQAKFENEKTILVGEDIRVTADDVVVAVGSSPFLPEDIDFDHPRIFCSNSILTLEEKPSTMVILGAGVIGCEYASMFRNLDVKINLVNSRDELLDFLDDEISDALGYHMRERGVVIRHNEVSDRIVGLDDGVITHLESGKQLKSDIFLWAAGRTGNTGGLGLEKVGLEANRRGYLSVDECFQSVRPPTERYRISVVCHFPNG